jgi:hypothetical protein
MGIATKIILMPCVAIEMLTKMDISIMAVVICLFNILYWSEIQTNGLNLYFDPQNTKIVLIQCIVTVLRTKTRFLVMAAIICILLGLPKDDRVASDFERAYLRGMETAKKICTDPIARLSKNRVWQLDYSAGQLREVSLYCCAVELRFS